MAITSFQLLQINATIIAGLLILLTIQSVGGYNLQVHFSKPEEFPQAIMIKHIRHGFPKMQIHDSTYSISAILVREDADYQDASNVLKRIVKGFCDEMFETDDILIET